MAMGLTYKLEREEGTPADRSTFKTASERAAGRHDPRSAGTGCFV
jgi:hypothetical protein